MKFLMLIAAIILTEACAPTRVLVKHSTCQTEPGAPEEDNCELIRKL